MLEAVAHGNDVRYAGEDIPSGATILSAGTLLGAAEIGGLAAVNIARPRVVRRPRLALVSTGDEIVDPGRDLLPGEIRDANRPALTAAARAAGAEVIASLRVGDNREDTIARALRGAARGPTSWRRSAASRSGRTTTSARPWSTSARARSSAA